MSISIRPVASGVRGRGVRHRHHAAADAGNRSPQSRPAWTATPCWCSVTSRLTDDQQLAFSRNFGELEVTLAGQMAKPEDRRLGDRLELGDISNLTARNQLRARDDRRRMYALANRLWHSDASFRAIGAGYHAAARPRDPRRGRQHRFADMRAAYDALDDVTKAEIEDLVSEHSIVFSREQIGFADYAAGNEDRLRPVQHRLVITHPVTGRKSLYLSSHIGGIVGWPVPEARAFIRDLMEHATQRQFVYAHDGG